jgi:hypothetical protein
MWAKEEQMKIKRLWTVIASVLVILALVWAATAVLAGAPLQGPGGGEENSNPSVVSPASPAELQQVVGDDPDEDGYAGPISFNTGDAIPPSQPGTGSGLDWEQFYSEPQPDQDEYYVSPMDTSSPAWSTFYYAFVAGSALHPVDSDTTWNYDGYGCVSASTGASNLFNVHLDLPQGSRIDYLRIFYYDTSSNDSRAWITTYDGEGGFSDLTDVDSSGNSGYGTALSDYVGHVVDTTNDSYVLNWRANQTGSTMRLCGLRVAYRLPD